MKKKNYLLLLATLLCFPLAIISCDDDDEPIIEPTEPGISGAFILNSGAMGKNNSTLDFYDFETEELNEKIFASSDGGDLGDTANDMIIYGSKIYITVTNSNAIEVIDLTGKSIKKIQPKNDKGQPQGPRFLASDKGKVYVTMSDGYLAQLDTTNLNIEKQVLIGLGTEQIAVVGDKLYTTVYGSYPEYDNKVISVNIATYEVADTIEVVINPTMIQADKNGMLFVLSSGNYFDIKKTLQRVNPTTGKSTILLENDEMSMTKHGDYLYIISAAVDPVTWLKTSTNYKKYNLNTTAFEEKEFVNSGLTIENATNAYVNPLTDQLYITAGDYVNTGNVYIISKDGALDKKIDVSGVNPQCIRFITSE